MDPPIVGVGIRCSVALSGIYAPHSAVAWGTKVFGAVWGSSYLVVVWWCNDLRYSAAVPGYWVSCLTASH